MNWVKQRLRNWINNDRDLYSNSKPIMESSKAVSIDDHGLRSQPFKLKIYNANGGIIVETSKYDIIKDRNINGLHIITHDQELSDSLAKIITMESLRG